MTVDVTATKLNKRFPVGPHHVYCVGKTAVGRVVLACFTFNCPKNQRGSFNTVQLETPLTFKMPLHFQLLE